MGELAKKLAKMDGKQRKKGHDWERHPEERRALRKLRTEARDKGATLASGGKGGLPPSMVLGVMRRDEFKCKKCGTQEDLTLHHNGGIVASKRLSRAGHTTKPSNISTLCTKCHDQMHEKAREEGIDSTQVTPEGDKGTSRDHGLPDARPKD